LIVVVRVITRLDLGTVIVRGLLIRGVIIKVGVAILWGLLIVAIMRIRRMGACWGGAP